ncbi:MAG: tRNA pseudouridine(38-40) synthase TruA [Lachnospiraceae bacterium]|nr:tRNA pseudouridine(38-40) synthase TruA [Lachnospiraceae bacterium]
MRRILIKAAYDGTDYHGWQEAENAETVAGNINRALKSLTGEDIEVMGASRTDAGVHARGNLAVFDTLSTIPDDRFSFALNTFLPSDIRIISSKEVPPDFHFRNIKTEKTYLYRIVRTEIPDPLRIRFAWDISFDLDPEKMRIGASYLLGEHDFKSFCSVHTDAKTTVREISHISLEEKEDEIHLTVKGYGFLYNMVRIITGTLVEIGRGKREPEDIPLILEALDRRKAGPTAPPNGLTLMNIRFL